MLIQFNDFRAVCNQSAPAEPAFMPTCTLSDKPPEEIVVAERHPGYVIGRLFKNGMDAISRWPSTIRGVFADWHEHRAFVGLFNDDSSNEKLTPDELQLVDSRLGAATGHIKGHQSYLLYTRAYRAKDTELLLLLQKHNIKIKAKAWHYLMKQLFGDRDSPAQTLDFLNTLSAFSADEVAHERMDREIATQYQMLADYIDAAVDVADSERKPLLILIGEHHGGFAGNVVETMVLNIMHQHSNIRRIFTESPECAATMPEKFAWTGSCELEKAAKDLGVKMEFIDFGLCTIPHEWLGDTRSKSCEPHIVKQKLGDKISYFNNRLEHLPVNEEGFFSSAFWEIREEIMADQVRRSKAAHNIVIVGASHLQGLYQALKDKFHIVPINAGGTFYDEAVATMEASPLARGPVSEAALQFAQSSDDVIKTSLPSFESGSGHFINPMWIQEKTKKAHGAAQQKKIARAKKNKPTF